jgi:hypothetical protein
MRRRSLQFLRLPLSATYFRDSAVSALDRIAEASGGTKTYETRRTTCRFVRQPGKTPTASCLAPESAQANRAMGTQFRNLPGYFDSRPSVQGRLAAFSRVSLAPETMRWMLRHLLRCSKCMWRLKARNRIEERINCAGHVTRSPLRLPVGLIGRELAGSARVTCG